MYHRGESVLHVAAHQGLATLATALLVAGAQPNLQTNTNAGKVAILENKNGIRWVIGFSGVATIRSAPCSGCRPGDCCHVSPGIFPGLDKHNVTIFSCVIESLHLAQRRAHVYPLGYQLAQLQRRDPTCPSTGQGLHPPGAADDPEWGGC